MVGALSVVDSHTSPCLCLDALFTTTNMNLKSSGDLVLQKRRIVKPVGSLELSNSFIDSGHDRWLSVKINLPGIVNRNSRKQNKNRSFRIVNEVAGQYDDSFEDVKTVRPTSFICKIFA